MTDKTSWTDIVAAVMVIYGAALSTYNLIRDIIKDKPKGKVECGLANFVGPGTEFDPMVLVSFSNVGRTQVRLEEAGLLLPDGKKLLFPSSGFCKLPAVVEPQESFSLWAPIREINASLASHGYKNGIKVKGYFRDAVSNYYYSKKMEYGILNH